MIFSSSQFIFIFMPLLLAFLILFKNLKLKKKLIAFSLFSLFFYGFYQPGIILLLVFSIILNYFFSKLLINKKLSKISLYLIIAINLLILFYFKYSLFILNDVLNIESNSNLFWQYALPIGISFYTFQQISYQVAVYKKEIEIKNFVYYFSYVSFFPQLIAGPIVRHNIYFPQIGTKNFLKPNIKDFEIGLTIFTIGIFKKIILADSIGHYVDLTYETCIVTQCSQSDYIITAIFYSFQIYFDFSAYSDMAIGIAKIFGVNLPINFNSPYKSKNLIIFWRNWHITLSNFLKDFIYIPLGGNKKGFKRKLNFLFITMLLGGIWHGAGYNFALWGSLHGIGLILVNIYSKISISMNYYVSVFFTFIFVTISWIFFRSENLSNAIYFLYKVIEFSSIQSVIYRFDNLIYWLTLIILSFFITFLLPNTFTIINKYYYKYQFVKYFYAVILVFCIMNLYRSSDFIYYEF